MSRPKRKSAAKSFVLPGMDGGSPASDIQDLSSGDSDAYVEPDTVSDGVDVEVPEDEGQESSIASEDDEEFGDTPSRGRGRGRGGRGRARGRGSGGAGAGVKREVRKPVARKRESSTASALGEKRWTAAAADQSSLLSFPPAYRDYLLDSASLLVRGGETARVPPPSTRAIPFPRGSAVPFVTRLTEAPPARGEASTAVDADDADYDTAVAARRDKVKLVSKHVAGVVPWQSWEGEGWWPEMFVGEGKGKGKAVDGPVPGWLYADQVRLGLDGVARTQPQVIATAGGDDDGLDYVPSANAIVLNLGVGADAEKITFAPLTARPNVTKTGFAGGFILAAGGPVWGLDWCPYPPRLSAQDNYKQYIAISTLPANEHPGIGSKCPPDTRGAIQIWSMVPAIEGDPGLAQCELMLCVRGGPVMELKWMPLGAWDEPGGPGVPKLGILAARQLDGSISMYAVPHPSGLRSAKGPTFIRADPLFKLEVADAAFTTMAWLSGHRLAAGLSNGHLAAYEIVDGLVTGEAPLPSVYQAVALSPIQSVAASRTPPTGVDGTLDYGGETPYVFFGAHDGTTGVVDVRDPGIVIEHNRARLPCMAVAWSQHVGSPIYADVDYMIILAQMRHHVGPATHPVMPHRGPVWEISTSDYHSMVASVSTDGALLVTNCQQGFYRRKLAGIMMQRIYEMDYDEHTQEYRMVDDFLPETVGLEEASSKAHQRKAQGKASRAVQAEAPPDGDASVIKTGAWPVQSGVHRVAWQNGAGIGRAGWVASGGYSGVVRLDCLVGEWVFGGMPQL